MDKLRHLQKTINVPKGQYNSFGKYKYRSLDDIYQALKKHESPLVPSSSTEIVEIGGRIFVKATVCLIDMDVNLSRTATSYAELPISRKGMSADQNTGACISYALKYAWGQLLCLDDNKDPDSMESPRVPKTELVQDVLKSIMSMPEHEREQFVGRHGVKSSEMSKYSEDELKELLVLASS